MPRLGPAAPRPVDAAGAPAQIRPRALGGSGARSRAVTAPPRWARDRGLAQLLHPPAVVATR
eukprot:7070800-Pyramimonas_sp.AAC.1